MGREDYLAPYPAVAQFLRNTRIQRNPDIASRFSSSYY
jgi:hypothetical protein